MFRGCVLFLVILQCINNGLLQSIGSGTDGKYPTHGKKVVCYMHSWSSYRKDLGQFSIEDIEPSLCTNIIYAFALLDETTNNIRSGDLWQDLDPNNGQMAYRRVTGLKERNPHLKVSISLGGWADGSAKYSAMAASPATRQTFIQSVLDFLKQHNFDGLDMHWKFPTLRGGNPYDKENYVLLLKELKEAFAPHNYLLTAAFGAIKSTIEAAYDLAKLNRHLDYMHLLAFDYHGAWDEVVGPNAPLRGAGQNDIYSLEYSVNYMINNGVSPGKIILGLPAFGHTFELIDPTEKSIEFGQTRTKSVGFQGENGVMGFNEICMEISNKFTSWSHQWDARSASAYIRDKERVVCYDSGRSIAAKVKMAVDRGLGGLMVSTLDTDDFRGLCDAEEESYVDFQTRFSELVKNPELPHVLQFLNLPSSDKATATDYYTTSNGQLSLRLPQQPSKNFKLLRTINTAVALALKEKIILNALPAEADDVGSSGPIHGKKVVCYMHSWSSYRKDLGQFSIENIEPSLCTNIIYAFALLDESTNFIKSGDIWQDLEANNGKMAYRRVTGLKETYPHLKVSISLGGWADGSAKYSAMAASPATRQTFIQSVLDFLKEHNFDGLDMHWKFPTLRDGKPYDKANYVLLLKELKEAFAPHKYILTAAFTADKTTMEAAYDLAKLNRHLDYMHLLAFDYHGAWDGLVGSNAPLRGVNQYDPISVEFSVNYMISNGVSPSKIILGLPAFGHTYELIDPTEKSIEFGRTRTKSVGFQGENGVMGYNEICMETSNKSSPWSFHWDAHTDTVYVRDKERVVCYDNGRSIASKVKMAVDHGLGGLMLWTLDTDDFRGLCDAEEESYVDFQTRFNELVKDPALTRVIRSLDLPTLDAAIPTEYYVISDGQLSLRLPQRPPHSTFGLLRTVNTATSLAVQEKTIYDELHGENDVDGPGVSGFRSDYVYHSQVGYWFKGHNEPADWHTARMQCHYEGAVLASPLSKLLATALEAIVSSFRPVSPKSGHIFIGVHQTFGKGMYTSVEGVPLDSLHISRWKDQPGNHKREQCLALASDGVQDRSCQERLPYICYRKHCEDDRIGQCGTIDKAYKLNRETGNCYKLHRDPAQWSRALRACGAEGGHLAVADSVAEASVLAELAGRHGAGPVGIGFHKWEDAWWNVQGKSLATSGYSEWCSNCSENGLCGALLAGKLAAVSCDTAHPFICEKETGVLTNATGAANGLPFMIC